ncbi:hypothetical protein [Micromonospora violae]|uniref:hypothetical protein n=1 Tax=Micromonospora violae TaxID=1278207 RepID=UPI0033F45C59
MLLKSLALATSVVAVLATAPAASAATPHASSGLWPAGNCPQGTFCIWPNWNHPAEGPVEPPSLVTSSEWTGRVPAFNFYNYTSRNAEITWSYLYNGSIHTGEICVRPNNSENLYVPAFVTKVTWQTHTC